MPTSGTTSFLVSRDDLISAALRLIQAFDPQETIPGKDIADAAQALNILAKELAIDGLPLWCVQDISVPLVVGQASYNLSTASGTRLPLRILDVFIRDSAGNDTNLVPVAKTDYRLLGQKAATGTPNQYYYDPQLSAGTMTVYNTPSSAAYTLHVLIQRQIQDFNLSTDTPDFPQEAYRLLKWCLADEIALEYQTKPEIRKEINTKAVALKAKFFNWEQEQVSVYFQPNVTQK